MAACFDLSYKQALRRPLVSTTNYHPTPKNCFHAAPARPSGFYEHFDTTEKLVTFDPRSPTSTVRKARSYGYEKVWRPARGKVEGAGVSSLGSNMTSRQPEQWRPSIKYIDPGTGTSVNDQLWRSSRKHVKPKDHSAEQESRRSRKKLVVAEKHPNGPEWPSCRAPGTFIPRPQWEPPFRKGNKDDMKPIKHPKKHSESYRDEYESSGVRNVLDVNALPLPVMGKKRSPTYRNEHLSCGVGAALKSLGYHPSIIL